MKETEIVKSILDYLGYTKIVAWRMNSGMIFLKDSKYGSRAIRMGKAGVSDIIGCLPDGRILCLEVKNEKGKPTEAQTEFLESIKKSGGVAEIVRSIDDVQEVLREVENKNL